MRITVDDVHIKLFYGTVDSQQTFDGAKKSFASHRCVRPTAQGGEDVVELQAQELELAIHGEGHAEHQVEGVECSAPALEAVAHDGAVLELQATEIEQVAEASSPGVGGGSHVWGGHHQYRRPRGDFSGVTDVVVHHGGEEAAASQRECCSRAVGKRPDEEA
jgi:hypothetical protein